MDAKNVIVGMRVVPHTKSTRGDLAQSAVWRLARNMSQPFLYVQIKDTINKYGYDHNPEETFVLSQIKDDNGHGDYYLASDFEPYDIIDKSIWDGIIVNPYDPRAYDLVGKKVVFSYYPNKLYKLIEAKNFKALNSYSGILENIDPTSSAYPFNIKMSNGKILSSTSIIKPSYSIPRVVSMQEVYEKFGEEVIIKEEE